MSEITQETVDNLERLIGDRDMLIDEIKAENDLFQTHLAKDDEQLATMREALEWYRDAQNYDRQEIFDILVGPRTPIQNDGGQRARKALDAGEILK